MRVSIFDYGVGNLHSLIKAVSAAGATPDVVTDAHDAVTTEVLILPGVGAFGPAAQRLAPGRAVLREAILSGLPTLGICLGMQLLFDTSEEGAGQGLSVFSGLVTRLQAQSVPHIGWNTLDEAHDAALTSAGLADVYYAHSYACRGPNTRPTGFPPSCARGT
jgi:imidazole glycerol-phosphate synthase subunit HisH